MPQRRRHGKHNHQQQQQKQEGQQQQPQQQQPQQQQPQQQQPQQQQPQQEQPQQQQPQQEQPQQQQPQQEQPQQQQPQEQQGQQQHRQQQQAQQQQPQQQQPQQQQSQQQQPQQQQPQQQQTQKQQSQQQQPHQQEPQQQQPQQQQPQHQQQQQQQPQHQKHQQQQTQQKQKPHRKHKQHKEQDREQPQHRGQQQEQQDLQQQQKQLQQPEQHEKPQQQQQLQQQQGPQQVQQQGERQQDLPIAAGPATAAGGLEEEVQRRLQACNANVVDVSAAQMFADSPDGVPSLIRCSGSQVVWWLSLHQSLRIRRATAAHQQQGPPCTGLRLLYIAETQQKEASSPFDNFCYKDTWGEQLLQHSRGVVVVGSISPPALVPLQHRQRGVSCAQACFIPDGSGIVCTEMPPEPYRRGGPKGPSRRSGCHSQGRMIGLPGTLGYEKRPHFGNARLRVATVVREGPGGAWVVKSRRTVLSTNPSPRGGPSLQHPDSGKPHSTEHGGAELSCVCVAGPQRESATRNGGPPLRPFQGLACHQLPPWRSRGYLLATTFIGCRQTVIAVSTDTAASGVVVRRVQVECGTCPNGSADLKATVAAVGAAGDVLLRDTRGPWLLLQLSSPVHPPVLVVAKIKDEAVLKQPPDEKDPLGPPLVAEVVDAFSLRGAPDGAFDGAVKKLQLHMLTLSLYHLDAQRHWLVRAGGPPRGPTEPRLAVLIHGGPHSCASCTYNRDVVFLTTLGFDVLAVNYRGSAGFGQEELVSVHGRAGRQDVDDVAQIVQQVVSRFGYDPSLCVAVGGSHGGFLCCHLIGQFPSLFSAASTRNPVTYIPGMYAASDIPDFVFPVSCGEDFTFSKTPSEAALQQMQRLSPTQFVNNIQTPLLLALGAKDLRAVQLLQQQPL
ncbi:acylamino-acid-releasing enzyme, putative [Eimeria mitis]|uniref:Acylamino-acid-releasing enzyme, putative n=1 Tax=Eimeria mitis TaxID=44415 RepID=U6KF58_9EIME|nr:acylamino-acid-releasing enzyme, putative [Eimeria mitis]CDJ36675.1 acylamino-acid-releasing enzyme, putative [Eimeria mitis]